MILKSLSHKYGNSFTRLINYIQKGMENKEHDYFFTQFIQSETPQGIASEFRKNDTHRTKRAKNRLYHTIMAFAPEDSEHLTPEILDSLVRKYTELRCPNALVYGAVHKEKKHIHVHLAISGTEYKSSKTLRLTRPKFYELRKEMERFQKKKFPELSHSLVYIDRDKEKERSLKESLIEAYNKSFTLDDFFQEIQSLGQNYIRAGRNYGIKINGKSHRYSSNGITEDMFMRLQKNQDRIQALDFRDEDREIER